MAGFSLFFFIYNSSEGPACVFPFISSYGHTSAQGVAHFLQKLKSYLNHISLPQRLSSSGERLNSEE